MKKLFTSILSTIVLFTLSNTAAKAQCTAAQTNWDNLDYLSIQGGSMANYLTYINTPALYTSMVQTQSFAIGVNRLTITHNYTSANNLGENNTNTAEAGSRGTGADVQYRGNGIITVSFDSPVSATSFSLYDIDRSQTAAVTALNGVTPVNITMAKLSGTVIAVTGSGTTTPVATATGTNVTNSSTDGTLNIDIPGTITSFTITITATGTNGSEDGSFWLSDINACVTGSFPTNYYAIAQPFTGQPSYILAVHDLNTVYMVDPATGRAVSIFTDNSPRVREINDLAYDPYKRIIYYGVDGLERCTPAGLPDSTRYIRKYDLNTETISQVINNVNAAPFNIPTYYFGLETGGAAFYNSSLYLAIDGTQVNASGNVVLVGREAALWRIDFAADSITPTKACQAYAQPEDNGSSLTHDWGDVTIKDGTLYDFNRARASAAFSNYNVFNMQTGATTTHPSFSGAHNRPTQAAQDWTGQLYWISDSITTYNGTNVLTYPKNKIVAAPRSETWVLGAGDAAEAFRPKADFGDAPVSYDPVALSPALHERDSALYLGPTFSTGWDWEWNKQTSADATGDGADDNDGLTFVSIFDKSTGNYLVQARVYNNTGANATLIGWFDYNGNNAYDPSEALTPITVTSSPAVQLVNLFWSGITSPIANGTYTFLRLRLTSAANGMTAANPTGYFNSGEVEDYRVLVDLFPLSANLVAFDAKAVSNSTARLTWTTTFEETLSGFTIERSADGTNWNSIGFLNAKGDKRSGINEYVFNDMQALKGKSYYRLKLLDANGVFHYSEVKSIQMKDMLTLISVMPNPAKDNATVYISNISIANTNATVILMDMQGNKMSTQKFLLVPGANSITLKNLDKLSRGAYIVQVITAEMIVNRKLIIGN
jgi:GEVED domain/Secretion system C-terminal sorting domain